MAIRSKQTQVEAVALKSFTGKEGRLSRGRRFFTTLARVEELEKRGLARLVRVTKAVEPEKKTKVVEPDAEKKAQEAQEGEGENDSAPTKKKKASSKKSSTKSKK